MPEYLKVVEPSIRGLPIGSQLALLSVTQRFRETSSPYCLAPIAIHVCKYTIRLVVPIPILVCKYTIRLVAPIAIHVYEYTIRLVDLK